MNKTMNTTLLPTRQGQICKLVNQQSDEVYIVTESDPSSYHNDATIDTVTLNDLQRNISQPSLAPRKLIKKSDLEVIADDLKTYVESWNKQ